jgi:hypothetical protein
MANFIPSEYNSSCERALEEISNRTLLRLKEENKINLRKEIVAYTTTEVFLDEVAGYLRRHPDEEISISSLIKFRTAESTSETGEKAGNIVPVVELGEKFKLGVKNDALTEEEEEN